jgi:hypothetical protein
MNKSTTKDKLQHQLDAMQAAVRNMPDHKTLTVGVEHLIPLSFIERRMDLRELDEYRRHAKYQLARELAEELIRSGSLEFREELEDCHRRFAKSLRVTAKLNIAA